MFGLKEKAGEVLEEQIPKVQALVREKLGPRAREMAANEELMSRCFGDIYEFLPAPVRLLVKKDKFVGFCLANRHRIIPEA